MKHVDLPLPEIAALAATRGMAGAGAALLFGSRLPEKRRKMIGWPLFLIGALSTVPLLLDIRRRSREQQANEPISKR